MLRLAIRTAILVATIVAGGGAHADIVIGVAGPMTGEFAPLGAQMKTGAAQAIADINAAGGVNGEKLALEVVDDACNARKADAGANSLVAKGVALVVGHLCLKASIAGAAVYAAARVVQISPGTTFAGFTDDRAGPGVFRLAGRDDAEGTFAGQMIAKRYAASNVAVVDDTTAYGKALADADAIALDGAGKQIVLRDTYAPGSKEYNTLVSRLQAAAVDVLYLGGANPEAAVIAKAMKARGMTATIVAGDTLLTQEYADLAGDAAEGTLVAYPSDPRSFQAASAVVAKFPASNIDPVGYTLPAYAAVQTWAAAAKTAGGTGFDQVVTALNGGPFATVIGSVAFDEKGDLRDPRYDWYVWRGGDYAPAGF
jgi:branched-chain amino acid transport system substrate-binding protein